MAPEAEAPEITEAARLSKLLFCARELIDMLGDIVEARQEQPDVYSRSIRNDIDRYRAERGWSPNGFGGEANDEAAENLRQISLMWAKRTNQGVPFMANTTDVPAMRELLAGYLHPDELPEPDDEEND